MRRPNDEAARSAAADAACPGSGSTTRHRFTACIGRSPRRLVPAVLAACGRLSRSVGLMRFISQHSRQTGRSDLCSRHQRGIPGRSAWCVNRVTQRCRISQVCRQSARDAGLVALAATHTSPDLPLTGCIDPGAARPCCVAVSQSNRKSAAQTATMHACPKIEPSRAGCVRLCACR